MPAIWRSVNRSRATSFVAFTAIGILASSTLADLGPGATPPNFQMTWDASLDSVGADTYDPSDFPNATATWGDWETENGTYTGWRYIGGFVGDTFELTWDCIVNDDPFIVATINVTNTTNSTQNFSNYMFLPLGGPVNPLSMSGSVSAGLSNNQALFTGASLSATSDPIYQAFIDTVGPNPPAASAVRTLWNPGFALTTTNGVAAANANDAFAPEPGPAAFNLFGLKLQFNLSALDSASVTGIFEIEPVPGPAGLAVFALFGAVAGRRRRRN